jgi:hypothetical protein
MRQAEAQGKRETYVGRRRYCTKVNKLMTQYTLISFWTKEEI